MKNCAIYTRVSTDNQAEKNFNSCETQELKINSFIDSQEDMSIYNVYSDPGFSGGNTNRPALKMLLEDIKDNKIDLVISYKIDRLTRSPKDFYQMIELFEDNNVDFISVTERFDTSTPSGRLLRNIMLTFAQFERELSSERTKDKMIERAKKGLWNGGNIPYGYKSEDKKLVIHPKEADNVLFMYSTYVNTGSLSKTYKILKRKNILKRDKNLFTDSNIGFMLRNKIYIGKILYDGKIYDGIHEPIISTDLFNEAQKIHRNKKRKKRVYKNYIFGGLIKCQSCGSTMTPTHTNKKVNGKIKRYHYYRCTSTFKKDWDSCDVKQVNATRLENYILGSLKRISKDKNYIETLIYRLNNDEKLRGRLGLEISGVCSKYSPERAEKTIKKLVRGLAEGKKTEKNLQARKQIKEIKYTPGTIEIILKYSVSPSSSAKLSSISRGRRQLPGETSNNKEFHTNDKDNNRITDRNWSGGFAGGSAERGNPKVRVQDSGSPEYKIPKYLFVLLPNVVHGSQFTIKSPDEYFENIIN
jgi:DNA invertase Pin-like site-specific DNA recombinase